MTIAVIALLALGFVFLFGASVGLLRLPDCYARSHACGLCDALGAQLCFIGLGIYALHEGFNAASLTTAGKIAFVAIFLLVTSPTASHAIFRGAYATGVQPWTKGARP